MLLVASTEGLIAGGVAGLFWSYIWTYVGMAFVVLSLAEMASMAPTSGGQYHWVSEFAPPQYQKILSYFTGWMSAMSWQAGAASGPFLVGTMIQSLVYVNKEEYEATNWQGTLMVWAITFIVYLGNVYGGSAMPVFQNVMLIVHVFGFLAVCRSCIQTCQHLRITDAITDYCHALGSCSSQQRRRGLHLIHRWRRMVKHGLGAYGWTDQCHLCLYLFRCCCSHE